MNKNEQKIDGFGIFIYTWDSQDRSYVCKST